MGQILLVTLREGIEMFLIVAIAATYLRKTGRGALLSAVTWGTITAMLVSVVLGVWLAEVAVLPKWESLLALIAAVTAQALMSIDVSTIKAASPQLVCELDMNVLKGDVRRLSWSADSNYLHVQTIERDVLHDFIGKTLLDMPLF